MDNNVKKQNHTCSYKFCRGTEGACPYSLVTEQELIEVVKDLAIKATAVETVNNGISGRKSHRSGLRIAMTACPNACTEPQTKDVGIIAIKVPTEVGLDCNGCGRCLAVCREDAIELVNSKAQLVPDKCVGCGQCINECPSQAISSEPIRFNILVGGRMGRHPRWAEHLCLVDGSWLVETIQNFFDRLNRIAQPGERLASMVERIGIAGLREETLVEART
jgi:anaerobic sulfite reductase subunit C